MLLLAFPEPKRHPGPVSDILEASSAPPPAMEFWQSRIRGLRGSLAGPSRRYAVPSEIETPTRREWKDGAESQTAFH